MKIKNKSDLKKWFKIQFVKSEIPGRGYRKEYKIYDKNFIWGGEFYSFDELIDEMKKEKLGYVDCHITNTITFEPHHNIFMGYDGASLKDQGFKFENSVLTVG